MLGVLSRGTILRAMTDRFASSASALALCVASLTLCACATGRVYEDRTQFDVTQLADLVPSATRASLRYAVASTEAGWMLGVYLRADGECVDREKVTEQVTTYEEREAPASGGLAIFGLFVALVGSAWAGTEGGDAAAPGTVVAYAGVGTAVISALAGIDREVKREVVERERDVRPRPCPAAPAEPFVLDLALGPLTASREVAQGYTEFRLSELFPCAELVAADVPVDAAVGVRLRLARSVPTSATIVDEGGAHGFVASCFGAAP